MASLHLHLHSSPATELLTRRSHGKPPSRTVIPTIAAHRLSHPAADAPMEASPALPHQRPWSLSSWSSKKASQQPEYSDTETLAYTMDRLSESPPLVFAGEARALELKLRDVSLGKAFLLQGGDCAESFKEFRPDHIRDTLRLLLQMSVVLMFGSHLPVVKV